MEPNTFIQLEGLDIFLKMKNENEIKEHGNRKSILKLFLLPIHFFRIIKEKIGFSIRLKLSLIYIRILISAMLLAGVGIIIIFGSTKIYNDFMYNYDTVSKILAKEVINYNDLELHAQKNNSQILIYDTDKKLLYSTKKDQPNFGYRNYVGIINNENNFFIYINKRVLISDQQMRVIIYTDISNELKETLGLAKVILYVLSTALVFAIISIFGSGKGVFRPIKEMTDTVRNISEKNMNLRLNVSGSKDELKDLAVTFNEMMNRIEDDYIRQKQFVSDASHELRTPIAVIQGYVDMLDRWGKSDKEVLQESIDAIKNESESMKDLVYKLLFLARNDKGTLVLEKEEFSLTEMLIETTKETQIIDNNHVLDFDIEEEVPLYGDRKRIKQAVRILIDNALKYTPKDGKITISLKTDQDYAKVSIMDTGIGMSNEELSHIFDRFYRSDNSRTREKGGHGLGLAIAKIIVLSHKGKIKVRSKKGSGSEFILFLPLKE